MSLPAAFRTKVETVPWTGAYLGADEALVREKRKQFAACSGQWAPEDARGLGVGGKSQVQGRRSAVDADPVRWCRCCAQWMRTGFRSRKARRRGSWRACPTMCGLLDGSSGERDLAETAALIAMLDVVITTDTCIAHLAGAMAKPVWILLPHLSDWRWMQASERTPWYPTARLFRQSVAGDWAGVVERVIAKVRERDVDRER